MLRKITNTVLILMIVFGFNLTKIDNFGIEKTMAAEDNQLANGDFESITNSLPTGWTTKNDGAKYAYSVVPGQTGNGFKLETNDITGGIAVATSPYVEAKLGDSFKVTFSYKAEPKTAPTAPITLYINGETFTLNANGSKNHLQWYPPQLISLDSQDFDGNWHQGEYTVYGLKSPDVKFLQLRMGSLYKAEGSVTYDNMLS